MNQELRTRRRLIRLLQAAYSSEMAAALAYQGHAASVSDLAERRSLRQIEEDEWYHRREIGALLRRLGAAPVPWREAVFRAVGRTIRAICPWSGWYAPMIVAGLIEMINVRQYVAMARWSGRIGLHAETVLLEEMAEVERRHQAFFVNALRARLSARRHALAAGPGRNR